VPDSGHNAYVAVRPDGTVDVPSNITPEGVIAAGDLVSRADLDEALGAALDGVVYTGDLSDEARTTAPGLRITDQYTIDISNPCGQLTGHDYDIDLTDSPLGWGWPNWTIVGYYFATGPAPVSQPSVRSLGGNSLRFQFISLASSLSLMEGTYVFNFIGNPDG
jgi:hypothetical protein